MEVERALRRGRGFEVGEDVRWVCWREHTKLDVELMLVLGLVSTLTRSLYTYRMPLDSTILQTLPLTDRKYPISQDSRNSESRPSKLQAEVLYKY